MVLVFEVNYLGIDIGSKRAKMVIINEQGEIVSSRSVDISDLISRPKPAWAERDPMEVWKRVLPALRGMGGLNDVEAVCIDATSGTIIPINKEKKPIFRALLYSDARAVKEAEELRAKSKAARDYEEFLPIAPYLVIPKIMWLRNNFKDFDKIYKILHENDFYSMLLTGEIATSPNIAGKAHVDIEKGQYIEEIYEDVGIDLDLMPPVFPTGAIIGYVTKEASDLTGIPEGVPVINGVTDSSAGDVATGTLDVGVVNVTVGTTLVVHGVVGKIVPDPKKRIYYKAYFEGRYLVGGATNAGTIPMDAISNLLKTSLELLEKQAEEVPPGSDGLIAQPQWIGTRIPESNPNMLGFFLGMTEKNCTPGHIYRSILEGNAFVLDQLLKIIEEVTGTEITEVRTTGGGARSRLLNQIFADVTQKPVKVVAESEPAVGSAIIAMWGIDRRKKISDLAKMVVKITGEFTPRKEGLEAYKRNEERLFEAMKLLSQIFA